MAAGGGQQKINFLLLENIGIHGAAHGHQFAPAFDEIDSSCGIRSGGEQARRGGLVSTAVDAAQGFTIRRDLAGQTGVQQRRHSHIARAFGQLVQYGDRFVQSRGDIVIQMIEELRGDAEAEFRNRRADAGRIIGRGPIYAIDIQVVVTGDPRHEQRGVFHCAGDGAAMIE